MQLEQMFEYRPRVSGQKQQTYFVVGDLESLSSVALYTGKITIRPLGQTQIHIHEGAGGSANIKYRDGTRTPISSYEAALLDLQLDKAGYAKIQTTTKGSNNGRT